MFVRKAGSIISKGIISWSQKYQPTLHPFNQMRFSSKKIVDSRQSVSFETKEPNHSHQTQEVSAEEKIAMASIEDYEKALQFFSKGKYRISHEFFRRTLDNLKKSGQQGSHDHVLVLKKMVPNQIHLKRYSEAEKTLEEIIEILQGKASSDSLIYKEYNNLFLHCLKYNLNKAIILGKALLSEGERKTTPPAYQKIFAFNLGTAYLLKSNFTDAKHRLRECITMDPNPLLRGFALNNLAVACWWHKHPSFRDFEDDEEGSQSSQQGSTEEATSSQYTEQQIDSDFENVISLLKKSIWNIENIDQLKDLSIRTQLQQLFDQNETIPAEHTKFESAAGSLLAKVESGIPLINIHEFIFHTSPSKKIEASFWFKSALKFYETVDPNNIERCLITLGVFCSNYNDQVKAEGLFKQALEMIGETDNYSKILCFQMYGKLLLKNPQRYKEGEEMIAQAHQIAEILPFWFNKINYVCIPNLDLS